MPVQVRVGVALAEALAECGGECGGEKQNPRKTPCFPRIYAIILAEREGFEPSIRGYRIHAFQACALNHSATSPDRKRGT